MDAYGLIKRALGQFTVLLIVVSFSGWQNVRPQQLTKSTGVLSVPTESLSAQKVLPSEKFVGKVAIGYKAAQSIPQICSKLFCYCGCDLTDNHTSLLDCFTCTHGMDCDICLDEVIIALHLHEQGKSLSEIQQTIDDSFAYEYPWDKPSPALIKYRLTYKVKSNGQRTKYGVGHAGKCCEH